MARGRKKHRSLFELMDPKGVYSAPALTTGPETQDTGEAEPQAEAEAAVQEVEEIEEQAAVEPEPVQIEDKKEPPAKTEADSEAVPEPILSVDDGKVRLVTNYPLAAMLCFAAVILLICAALVGWRLGHDSALKKVAQAQKESQQEIPDTNTRERPRMWNQ